MKDRKLNEVAINITRALRSLYGFAGLANSTDKAWINSTDEDGNEIKIEISCTPPKDE